MKLYIAHAITGLVDLMSTFNMKNGSKTPYTAVLTIECCGTSESQLKIFLKRTPEDYALDAAHDPFADIPASFLLMNRVIEFILHEVNGERIGEGDLSRILKPN